MDQEELEPIEIPSIKALKKPSIVVNNFYSLITIIIMCVVIIWYVNYVLPQQNKLKAKRLEQERLYKQREAQIRLSHKLHKKLKNDRK